MLPHPRELGIRQEDATDLSWLRREGDEDDNVTSDHRFSFVPGDDGTFPVDRCQEIRHNTRQPARNLEANMKRKLNEQVPIRPLFDKPGNKGDVSELSMGVAAPSIAGLSHGAASGTGSQLRSNDFTDNITNIADTGAEGHEELRIHDSISSKTTAIRVGTLRYCQDRRKKPEITDENHHALLAGQPAQRQNSAQLAASSGL
jgi:hypothetical protein